MEKRFKIKLESVNVLVIEDEMTGNFGISLYKDVNDISFLQALNSASYDLVKKLTGTDEPEEDEPEEDEPTDDKPLYTGVAIITKGDDALFPTGAFIGVEHGKATVKNVGKAKKEIANAFLNSFVFNTFEELKEYFDLVDIDIAELKKWQV